MTDQVSIAYPIDRVSKSVETITHSHHEIHKGGAFTVHNVQSVSTTTFKWQVTTLDSAIRVHMLFQVEGTGEVDLLVTEGSDRDDGGALTEINRDRTSSNVATTIVTTTPTGGSTDGATTIMEIRAGSTQGSKTAESGGSRGTNEFILKPNTKYVISVTTYAAVYITLELNWYEE